MDKQVSDTELDPKEEIQELVRRSREAQKQIENYKTYSTDDDVVITEINDILKYDVYEEVCSKLQLVVNKENYDKCKVLFENKSHL